MHVCTPKDFSNFSPPASNFVKNKVTKALNDGSIFCLNYDDLKLDLQGSWRDGKGYRVLDAMLIPCATKIKLHDGTYVGGEDDCVWDRQAVNDYMG